jgi:hypothetical protein
MLNFIGGKNFMSFEYYHFRSTMERLGSIVHNSSQGNEYTKDEILNSLIGLIEEYNKYDCLLGNKIVIKDFRKE